ncbi:hypothetical protein R6Q57_007684 [Mikania cordata]
MVDGHCSFKEALLGGKEVSVICIPAKEPDLPRWWMGYSLIGITKDLETLNNIVEILELMGINGVTIRYVGGLRIFISFPGSVLAKQFLKERKEDWTNWFSNLELWNGQDFEFERVVVLKVYGIPAKLWAAGCFNLIGEHFGRILQGSSTSYHDYNLTYEKITILTNKLGSLSGVVSLAWKNQCFKIYVCEDVDDWTPSFLLPIPESAGSCRNSGVRPISDDNAAWEPKSCNNEEREECEIIEKNHCGKNSEAVGEG